MELNQNQLKHLARFIADEIRVDFSTPPGRWMTMDEAKEYARVKSKNTLKSWIRKGKIYGYKRSARGDWIIDRESIDAFYNSWRLT